MAYTDEVKNAPIQSAHLVELAAALQAMAKNKKVAVQALDLTYGKITSVNVKLLQTAIHQLETSFSNNCCQADCCQTCQDCQACQGCQTCQRCQTCQTSSKTCQSCQSCQQSSECGNCDCNCGDDA
uniref:Uncharacterized protein n=1 Tax=Siphoviridae sp. ctr0c13 TaxID=2825683 RepID=A0A8S5TV19_9CAUD|nr:MAG TPA: hypothetical protein [Siphoviridae sp. ctr0c13]